MTTGIDRLIAKLAQRMVVARLEAQEREIDTFRRYEQVMFDKTVAGLKEARAMAIEECAKVCESKMGTMVASECAAAIRALASELGKID